MELTYGQLEATLAAHFRIKPDRLGTFRSRIKQLQRLEFPPGVNIGRGAKMTYGASHLVKLAFAFELIGAGFPAMLATRVTEENWRKIGAAVATDYRNRLRLFLDESIFVRIIVRTFSEVQFDHLSYGDVEVFVEDHAALLDILKRHSSRTAGAYTIVCITDFTNRLMKLAGDVGGVHGALYDGEVIGWLVPNVTPSGSPSRDANWLRLKGKYPEASDEDALKVLAQLHGPEIAKNVIAELRKVEWKRDRNPKA